MKTALNKVPNDKAANEMQLFSTLGFAFAVISLIIFWWLAMVGLAFSGRGLLLTWHKANIKHPKRAIYRALAVAGAVISIVGLVAYLSSN